MISLVLTLPGCGGALRLGVVEKCAVATRKDGSVIYSYDRRTCAERRKRAEREERNRIAREQAEEEDERIKQEYILEQQKKKERDEEYARAERQKEAEMRARWEAERIESQRLAENEAEEEAAREEELKRKCGALYGQPPTVGMSYKKWLACRLNPDEFYLHSQGEHGGKMVNIYSKRGTTIAIKVVGDRVVFWSRGSEP